MLAKCLRISVVAQFQAATGVMLRPRRIGDGADTQSSRDELRCAQDPSGLKSLGMTVIDFQTEPKCKSHSFTRLWPQCIDSPLNGP
jgi:hypothetical protein